MIQGTPNWFFALNQPAKRPLYVLIVPSLGIVLGTFPASLLPVNPQLQGYGVSYGQGYGSY